jgi:hypothetical protein
MYEMPTNRQSRSLSDRDHLRKDELNRHLTHDYPDDPLRHAGQDHQGKCCPICFHLVFLFRAESSKLEMRVLIASGPRNFN